MRRHKTFCLSKDIDIDSDIDRDKDRDIDSDIDSDIDRYKYYQHSCC